MELRIGMKTGIRIAWHKGMQKEYMCHNITSVVNMLVIH